MSKKSEKQREVCAPRPNGSRVVGEPKKDQPKPPKEAKES